MSESFERATVGEIVATDFRTAGVFEQFGIDFCCGGRQSLTEACRAATADLEAVERALEALPPADAAGDDVTRWPEDRVIDHILATHHAYARSAVPQIARYVDKLVDVHGARHPELRQIAVAFDRVGRDLLRHMSKEESELFPYIRDLATATSDGRTHPSTFATVDNPIQTMEREHREAGDELRLIRELTNGYMAPPDGCTTYRAAFAALAEFERDLHRHIHLENSVLFPKAIELEHRAHVRSLQAPPAIADRMSATNGAG